MASKQRQPPPPPPTDTDTGVEYEEGQIHSTMDTIGRVILFLFGSVSTILLSYSGVQMLGVVSQSGQSIAEAYYHAMGLGFIGLGILGGGLSIGMAWKD